MKVTTDLLRKKGSYMGSAAKSSGLSRSKMSLSFDVALIFALLSVCFILFSVKWSPDLPKTQKATAVEGTIDIGGLSICQNLQGYLLFRRCRPF